MRPAAPGDVYLYFVIHWDFCIVSRFYLNIHNFSSRNIDSLALCQIGRNNMICHYAIECDYSIYDITEIGQKSSTIDTILHILLKSTYLATCLNLREK